MIKIHLKDDRFEADVRAMVQAFYPGSYLYVYKDKTNLEVQRLKVDEPIEFELDIDTDYDDKNELKRCLYEDLRARTKRELPWGTLTGIRPTKIPTRLIEAGADDNEIIDSLKKTYLVSDKKAKLALKIAHSEHEILSRIDKASYSLYIHIPFCPTRCAYCSFTSFPVSQYKDLMGGYVEALTKELEFIAKKKNGHKPASIYIGGGTPTALDSGLLGDLCDVVRELFCHDKLLEWTVEAGRPDSIDTKKLNVLKSAGVGRISINPQTMNRATLDIIGRRHSVEDIYEAYRLAREAGFDNINADLIMGLPNEGEEEVRHTLSCIEKMAPESLTIHSLSRKHNADMTLNSDAYREYTLANAAKFLDMADETADRLNLKPYYLYRQRNISGNQENIGYAASGKEGYYNILIMEEYHSILSAGAGAITKIVDVPGHLYERIENVKDVRDYITRIDEMIERKEGI